MIISAGVENLTSWERKLLYMCNARPTINTRALFSDATNDYRCPAEPMPGDTVKIRLRTGRYNVDKAYIYVNNVEYPMTKIKAVGVFDYYEAEIKVNNDKLYYYFKVETGKVVCYYNQIGAIKELNTYYNFQIMPGFKTPDGLNVNTCIYYNGGIKTTGSFSGVKKDYMNASQGIIYGLDKENYKNVLFNVDEPGLFSDAKKTGKTIYNNYKLTFDKQDNGNDLSLIHI